MFKVSDRLGSLLFIENHSCLTRALVFLDLITVSIHYEMNDLASFEMNIHYLWLNREFKFLIFWIYSIPATAFYIFVGAKPSNIRNAREATIYISFYFIYLFYYRLYSSVSYFASSKFESLISTTFPKLILLTIIF